MTDDPQTTCPGGPEMPAQAPPAPPVFTPEQVTRLIQRAAELDAHGERLDADEVKRIAREAGIDSLAMEQAIGELLRGEVLPAPPAPDPKPVAPSKPKRTGPPVDPGKIVRSLLMAAGMGFGTAILAASALEFGGLAVAAIAVFLLVRAAQMMSRGAVLEFELQNLVTILVFSLTFAPFTPNSLDPEDWLPVMFLVWICASVLGGFMVWYGGRSLGDGDDADRDS